MTGGLPYNSLGWLLSTVLLRALSWDVFSTSIYSQRDVPCKDEASYSISIASHGEGSTVVFTRYYMIGSIGSHVSHSARLEVSA